MRTKTIEDGVSPVVGVMLMLVVTIIIAAVVSAFAGGLASSEHKTPQATISAKYSQSGGLTFTHNGGDPISTGDMVVQLRESTQIYQDADHWISVIDKGNISDGNQTSWNTWNNTVTSFVAGDTAYISATNSSGTVLFPQLVTYGTKYTLSDPVNIGKIITLELYDAKTNKIVAEKDIIIKP